jgi:hypothetical protein
MVSDTHVPPAGIQVACFQNRDWDAINCATFEKFCEQYGKQGDLLQEAVFVFMDSLEMKDNFNKFVAVKSNAVKQHFLTQVGENDCRHGFGAKKNQRVEPTLTSKKPIMFNGLYPCGVGKKLFAVEKNI